MSEAFIREGLFRAIVGRAPTFLSHAEEGDKDEALEILTGVKKRKSSAHTDLNTRVYEAWLTYINHNSREKYGTFKNVKDTAGNHPALPTSVELIKRLSIFQKTYSIQSVNEGNSSVEYQLQGKSYFGRIQQIFRTPVIPTDFLYIQPFTELCDADATKNLYAKYPGLLATMKYEKPAECVVIDACNLISHIAWLKNLPKSFDIIEKTVSIVSLKHAVSCSDIAILVAGNLC